MITEHRAVSSTFYPAKPSATRSKWAGPPRNGDLLQAAEEAAFDLLLTTDQRIRYQQNLSSRKIAIVVLTGPSKWVRVQLREASIADAINAAEPGSYAEVFIRFR